MTLDKKIFIRNFISNESSQKKNKSLGKIFDEIKKDTKRERNVFSTLNKNFKFNFKIREFQKYKKFKLIVIVGMGGSILGSEAIYEFLQHKIKKDVIFLNNLNENEILKIKKNKNLKKGLFIFISKSGNTLETLSNINLLNKINFDNKNTIVVTEKKKENALKLFAEKRKIPLIEHKKYIGGRFSVLSEVGMLPAFLMGLNFKKISQGSLISFQKIKKNLLLSSANQLKKIFLSKKVNSIIFFNYSPQLNSFTYWCQQLLAESLGKNGKGLTPVVSTAPKDHHSLLQLYLDGPKDKVFYVISSKCKNNINIKKNLFFNKYKFLKNKKLEKIILSQKNAFISVLKQKKIPYREIQINTFSEETLGELFSFFIIETFLIAKLINVNPFNQPSVESVKNQTRKNLIR